jgi:hypothetical protein
VSVAGSANSNVQSASECQSARGHDERRLVRLSQRDLVIASLVRCPDRDAGDGDRCSRPSRFS